MKKNFLIILFFVVLLSCIALMFIMDSKYNVDLINRKYNTSFTRTQYFWGKKTIWEIVKND